MITTKGCKFYLNDVELPYLHVDDLRGAKFGEALTKEQVSKIMITAIRKAELKGGDRKCQGY